MGKGLTRRLDRTVRLVQNTVGPQFTEYAQQLLGRNGTRFIREALDRSPRHRVQVNLNNQTIGSGINSWMIWPDMLTRESIVYSLGVGNDISFDLDLINRFGVTVFAFDPTPESIDWLKSERIPSEFHFTGFGIADTDGFARFYPLGNQCTVVDTTNAGDFIELPVHRLITVMSRLGHERIDLLKMDIEGSEYAVIEDMIESGVLHSCGQLLVEFHHRFQGVGASKTETAVASLNRNGHQIFHISDSGNEYSFIRI